MRMPSLVLGPDPEFSFFMLKSNENEISTAPKNKILRNNDFSCFKTLRYCIYPADKC